MATYLGIDLGGTSVKGGRVGSSGLLQKEVTVLNQKGKSDEIFEEICHLIGMLWSEDVEGIGFAVPALIDMATGSMYGLSNLTQLDGFPIKARLSDRFNVPVLLQNDANCFVLGEKYFGSARGLRDVIGLITGTGVGAGLILNNRLYNGINYGAGEFGMISYKDKCFEDYCGGKFFNDNFSMSGEELSVLAGEGDSRAFDIFRQYGQNLGELIKLICYSFDPQIITIGGSVSNSFKFYRETLNESLKTFFFANKSRVKIVKSELEDAAIYGASSLFHNQKPLHLKRNY
jgi:glucokinase